MKPLFPLVVATLSIGSCTRTECANPDYHEAECRVVAAYEMARIQRSDGVEVRFQDPSTQGVDSWAPLGRWRVGSDGLSEGRVAALGAFRVSVHRGEALAEALQLRLTNVHPAVELPGEVSRDGLTRVIEVDLSEADVVEVRGELPAGACDGGARVVAVGDIQTNPQAFSHLVDALHDEMTDASAEGSFLAGVLFLGDASEHGTRDEFDEVEQLLSRAPIPTAMTPGNHDITHGTQPVYTQVFGPGNLSFDVCGTRLVLLDSGSAELAGSVVGRLPDLLGDGPAILGTHYPLQPRQSTNGWTREDHAQQLVAELAARDAPLVLAGHVHRRLAIDDRVVPHVIVGTGGADQGAVEPDFGYLRLPLDRPAQRCFVSVPGPVSSQPTVSSSLDDCP